MRVDARHPAELVFDEGRTRKKANFVALARSGGVLN